MKAYKKSQMTCTFYIIIVLYYIYWEGIYVDCSEIDKYLVNLEAKFRSR